MLRRQTSTAPTCRDCGGRTIAWGKDREGNPRRRCKTFGIIPDRPLGSMQIDLDRAVLILSLLTEGTSIRSAERISGTHRDTSCGSSGRPEKSASPS